MTFTFPDSDAELTHILVVADPARSRAWYEGVLGAEVVVPEIAETTALGAAYLAGIATGSWCLEQVGEMWREAARYEPTMGTEEREDLLGEWRRALRRAKGWAVPERDA